MMAAGPGRSCSCLVLIHTLSSNNEPGSTHRCVFRASACTVVLPPEEVITPADNFTITLHRHISGKEQVSLVDSQYLPRRHGEAWGGRLGGKHLGCQVWGRALQ